MYTAKTIKSCNHIFSQKLLLARKPVLITIIRIILIN